MNKIALVVGLAIALAAGGASAAPKSISFAGRLSTSAGPVNSTVTVTFTIYDAPAPGGISQWTETVSLTAVDGLVYANLGTTENPLDETVFTGAARFLEIIVGGELLSPRIAINSAPYAVRSSSADSADLLGGTISPSEVVTAITAGSGLSGGGSGGAVSLAVDTNVVQARLTGSCGLGNSIREISQTGVVTCEPDDVGTGDITGVTAGAGLSGGGPSGGVTLSVDTTAIQARVTGVCLAGNAIREILPGGGVTCEAVAGGAGDITAVTAGTGLIGGGPSGAVTLSVNTTAIQARVDNACNAGSSIRAITDTGGVTCEPDDVGTGDITDVIAGAGLNGGGTSGSVTLSVNTAAIQARVGNPCNAGQSIRAISDTGGVTCEPDDTVTPGAGLLGSGAPPNITVSVDTNAIQSRVTATCPAGQAIRVVNANGGVTCDTAARAAGVAELTFANTVNIPQNMPAVVVLTLNVPGSPSGVVNLHGNVLLERTGTNSQYEMTIRAGTCAGTIVARTFWRAVSTTENHADTLAASGIATGVTAPATFVMCVGTFVQTSTSATASIRALTASW